MFKVTVTRTSVAGQSTTLNHYFTYSQQGITQAVINSLYWDDTLELQHGDVLTISAISEVVKP